MKKFLRGLVTAALFGLALSPFAPATAAQAGHFHSKAVTGCVQTSLAGGTVTKAGGGAAVAEDGKLEFSTGLSNDDWARWRKDLAVPVKLSSLTELSYKVTKTDSGPNPAAAPALRLYLKDGAELYTIVHEPYYQSGGNLTKDVPRVENAVTGKWWSGKAFGNMTAVGGGAYASNKTLADMGASSTMVIVGYGFQVGTYNQGTTGLVENFVFKASEACSAAPTPTLSASTGSKSPTASPTQSSEVYYETCADAPHKLIKGIDAGYRPELDSDGDGTACEAQGDRPIAGGLPLTGSKPLYIAGLAGVILIVGGSLAIWGRRRKVRFGVDE